jgi:transposase
MESIYDGMNWLELAAICRKRDLPTNSGDRKSSWLDLKQRLVDNDARQERVWSVASINRVTELEAEVARLRAQLAKRGA